ncbi:hypothetical protein BB561_001701 [Smittium simulii]|uniref:Uncharacterized protein n=1 Tax=Smittium simulii TaxID=133385 RepID=A0A2T9YTE4_9FUNG|nr:hypothetical protein BB561_001701 [Smittium simulii]
MDSAPIQTSDSQNNQSFCKDFGEYFTDGFRCDLTGAFVSSDENNQGKHSNSEIITNNNLSPGNAIPEKDINFKDVIEEYGEPHFGGGDDDIAQAELGDTPAPFNGFNDGIDHPAPPNSPVDFENVAPDFEASFPQDGANLAGSLDINFKDVIEEYGEPHFGGGDDDIAQAELGDTPAPFNGFNDGIDHPAPPNSPVDFENVAPDFEASFPQEGANLAGSLSTAEEVLAIAGSIIP